MNKQEHIELAKNIRNIRNQLYKTLLFYQKIDNKKYYRKKSFLKIIEDLSFINSFCDDLYFKEILDATAGNSPYYNELVEIKEISSGC